MRGFKVVVGENRDKFVKEVCEVMKIFPSLDYFERPLFITVSYAYYSHPSMVIIELEGSPPRLPVVCDICSGQCHPIYVNGKFFSQYGSEKQKRIAGSVRRLLNSEGIDDSVVPS